jgi:hypothetical protein
LIILDVAKCHSGIFAGALLLAISILLTEKERTTFVIWVVDRKGKDADLHSEQRYGMRLLFIK